MKREIVLDEFYLYRGTMNNRIKIIFDDTRKDEYPDYILISDCGEFMYKTKSLYDLGWFIVDLFEEKYA